MKQIEDEYICKYCMGCNEEELEWFKPKMNCKNFVQAYSDWQKRYYEGVKKLHAKEKRDKTTR